MLNIDAHLRLDIDGDSWQVRYLAMTVTNMYGLLMNLMELLQLIRSATSTLVVSNVLFSFVEDYVSPLDFGAVGDGVADDRWLLWLL